jgi:hypothetical protein
MVLQPRHRLLALDVRDALVRISQSSGKRRNFRVQTADGP